MNWYKIAQENEDIQSVASELHFKPVRKNTTVYSFQNLKSEKDIHNMPEYSYGIYSGPETTITTHVSSGKETSRPITDGMVIVSGVNKEKYFMTPEKFNKNYSGGLGNEVTPEQSERIVARYNGDKTINFIASYGSETVLMPGDYLVKEGNGYYRIAREEFEKTYGSFD